MAHFISVTDRVNDIPMLLNLDSIAYIETQPSSDQDYFVHLKDGDVIGVSANDYKKIRSNITIVR